MDFVYLIVYLCIFFPPASRKLQCCRNLVHKFVMRQKLEDDRQTATRLLHVARAQHAHGPVKETEEQGQYNTIHLFEHHS